MKRQKRKPLLFLSQKSTIYYCSFQLLHTPPYSSTIQSKTEFIEWKKKCDYFPNYQELSPKNQQFMLNTKIVIYYAQIHIFHNIMFIFQNTEWK